MRDEGLLTPLISNAAKPLESARLAVADYLHADDTIRDQSIRGALLALCGIRHTSRNLLKRYENNGISGARNSKFLA